MRDNVRTTPFRIGGDGLAVRKKDNREEDDDGNTERNNIGQPGEAKRHQDGQRCFGSVCRRAERIQTKDWHAGGYPDPLAAFFGVCERPSKQKIEK